MNLWPGASFELCDNYGSFCSELWFVDSSPMHQVVIYTVCIVFSQKLFSAQLRLLCLTLKTPSVHEVENRTLTP